jgi:chaperonin GroEL (HSP60 family)
MISKINSLKCATEAANSILHIEDIIKMAPGQREQAPAH